MVKGLLEAIHREGSSQANNGVKSVVISKGIRKCKLVHFFDFSFHNYSWAKYFISLEMFKVDKYVQHKVTAFSKANLLLPLWRTI